MKDGVVENKMCSPLIFVFAFFGRFGEELEGEEFDGEVDIFCFR